MRRRLGARRKVAAVVAMALFALAQPRMFCAVHCLILDHVGGDTPAPVAPAAPGEHLVAEGTSAPPVADSVCGHMDTILTSTPAIPVGSVGPATLAVVTPPVFGEAPPKAMAASYLLASAPVMCPVDTPPPRA